MNDKLKLLLKQININETSKSNFENGTLDKIICNKAKDK